MKFSELKSILTDQAVLKSRNTNGEIVINDRNGTVLLAQILSSIEPEGHDGWHVSVLISIPKEDPKAKEFPKYYKADNFASVVNVRFATKNGVTTVECANLSADENDWSGYTSLNEEICTEFVSPYAQTLIETFANQIESVYGVKDTVTVTDIFNLFFSDKIYKDLRQGKDGRIVLQSLIRENHSIEHSIRLVKNLPDDYTIYVDVPGGYILEDNTIGWEPFVKIRYLITDVIEITDYTSRDPKWIKHVKDITLVDSLMSNRAVDILYTYYQQLRR